MSRAEDIANSFMSSGRVGSVDASQSFELNVSDPAHATVPGFNLEGFSKEGLALKAKVNYDRSHLENSSVYYNAEDKTDLEAEPPAEMKAEGEK